MAYNYKGEVYSSKKHPILEYIFNLKNPNKDNSLKSITFTLKDISNGYNYCGIPEPASISNTILDLTRKKRPIASRLPKSIYELGYDLRKKTGSGENGQSFAGEFLFVGIGNEIESWLSWPKTFLEQDQYIISSKNLPNSIQKYLRNDEGGLFSVIDYCDVLSQILNKPQNSVIRIQNPLKWQPNEIDGFYFSQSNNRDILYPIEAKALTTGDDINLEQMLGAMLMMCSKYKTDNIIIQPLAVKMVRNGIHIAIFSEMESNQDNNQLNCVRKISVNFNPLIESWK
jgi:hypothetical protein|tara:strand:- start:2157 stop:3011 length:855 start_codon:yes stop_codon:yes gene_type:complete